MRRRDFLVQGSRAALGVSLVPLVGCDSRKPQPVPGESSKTPALTALIADLEKQIPVWMREAMVPGLSIAIIENARLAWRRGFGVKDNASNVPVDDGTMFEAASM